MLKINAIFAAIFLLFISSAGQAQTPDTASLQQMPVFDPYTVTDVMVDKAAKNAVVAREEAIVEAQRSALQKLADRNLTPEELKNFTLPDDKTIASVIQDFEIKGEQLSFTRYAANFTVRFRDGVRNFVNIRLPEVAVSGGEAAIVDGNAVVTDGGVGMMEAPRSKFLLVLPYFETISGQTLLWEDPNPWRRAWQNGFGKMDTGDRQLFVPLGDINDVSAGSSDAVWSGDYSAVEKLRASYKAEEVILAVANKSGALLTVDIYSWKDGKFERRETLKPYISDLLSEEDTYKVGANEVMKYLQKKSTVNRPVEAVVAISRELVKPDTVIVDGSTPAAGASVAGNTGTRTQGENVTEGAPQAAAVAVPARPLLTAGSATEIEGMMSFTDFSKWMEMQKRLAKMTPPVKVDIRSISKQGASFTMKFQGSVDILKKVMADNGIAMGQPAVQIDPSVLGSNAAAPQPMYDLQLVE